MLQLPDISGAVLRHQAKMAPTIGGGGAAPSSSATHKKQQQVSRAASDPIRMFHDESGGGGGDMEGGLNRDVELPSRSSTVVALAGSFDSSLPGTRGGGSGASNMMDLQLIPEGSVPKRRRGQLRADKRHQQQRSTDVRSVQKHMNEKVHLAERGPLPKLTAPQQQSKKKKQHPLVPAATGAPPPPRQQQQQQQPPTASALGEEGGTTTVEREQYSKALVSVSSGDHSGVGGFSPVVDRTSPYSQYSPESTMDRPDPANVPRIIPSAAGTLEGTLLSSGGGGGGFNASLSYPQVPGGTNSTAANKKGPTKCLYGKKLERRLAHPLQEERPFFDVWPASNPKFNITGMSNASTTAGGGTTLGATFSQHESVFVRPQLLNELENEIRTRLQQITVTYPKYAEHNRCNPPADDGLLSPRHWTSAMKAGNPKGEKSASRKSVALVPSTAGALAPSGAAAVPQDLSRSGLSDIDGDDGHTAGGGEGGVLPDGTVDLEAPYVEEGEDTTDLDDPHSRSLVAASAEVGSPNQSVPPRPPGKSSTKKNKKKGASSPSGEILMRKLSTTFEASASEEDRFRSSRVRVFSEAMKEFADQFKSYRRLLLWMAKEFDDYLSYCHRNVLSPDAREQFKEAAVTAAREMVAGEVASVQSDLAELKYEYGDLQSQYKQLQQFSSGFSAQLADKDQVIKMKDMELQEAAEGRAAMLGQIDRLEKEIWEQRNIMEGPEKRCQELQGQLELTQDKVKRGLETIDELAKERAVLRLRMEKLEENQAPRGGGGGGGGPTGGAPSGPSHNMTLQVQQGDLLVYKKRESDILERLAQYKSEVDHVKRKLKELNKQLVDVKASQGKSFTPRPNWAEVDEVIPRAPSTAKRVVCAAVEMSQLVDAKELAVDELNDLKDMIGSLPRNLSDVSTGETYSTDKALGTVSTGTDDLRDEDKVDRIVHDMQCRHFFKLGLATTVPTFLKGIGHVPNLKFTRKFVEGFCRLLWVERETASKATIPVEQFMSRFCAKNTLPDVDSDVFAYNLHHAIHWYAFDPFIGFTKEYLTGRVDELAFYSMQSQVRQLKEALAKEAATTMSEVDSVGMMDDAASNSRSPAELSLGGDGDEGGGAALHGNIFSKTRVITALMDTLTMKSESLVKEMILAMSRDCPGKDVDLNILFAFDANQKLFSNFLEEWYSQYLKDRQDLQRAMAEQLFNCATDNNHETAPPDVAAILWEVDPDAPVWYMDHLIAYLFDVKEELLFPSVNTETNHNKHHVGCEGLREYQCEDTVTSELPDILRRLKRYPLRRFTSLAPAEDPNLNLSSPLSPLSPLSPPKSTTTSGGGGGDHSPTFSDADTDSTN